MKHKIKIEDLSVEAIRGNLEVIKDNHESEEYSRMNEKSDLKLAKIIQQG